ncbi:stalk domain-containing protein [Paenibacillus favisporus]|uniref:stalk domain-containing protein n=1 Tax=Paenibacillus favisporus TaxID=221028 RepID=UPI002DBC2E4A|nr:stalk domain-containing protein [Paenibacillus favisporus]MEC0175617.1 stalk domain-containing protein [Paenibacillus favisporus]
MKKLIIGLTVGMLIGSSTVAMAATSSTVKATLVKYKIIANGIPKQVASNQLSYNGNTYVQLRDAGSIFGYNTTYEAASKTIKFIPKDGTEGWITLGDYAGGANFKVEVDENKPYVYNLVRGKDEIISSFNTQDLKEREERGSSTTTNGTVIYFTKINGSLVLSKESLKKAGLM